MTVRSLYCYFCGKPQEKVKKLVAGPEQPNAHVPGICDECVWAAWEVIVEEGPAPARFKGVAMTAKSIILYEYLADVEYDLMYLNAKRDNVLHDLSVFQEFSTATIH